MAALLTKSNFMSGLQCLKKLGWKCRSHGLHAWLLDQVRQFDPALSASLYDGESEKPFTISALQGVTMTAGGVPKVTVQQLYTWTITALSQPVAA